MMKNQAVVKRLPKKSRKKREIVKHFASTNNVQYNVSIEYTDDTKATVKEFSMGYVLRELHINDTAKKKTNSPPKTSDDNSSALCIFWNFINFGKFDLRVPENLRPFQKVQLYKNVKFYFHGVHKTDTTKVNLRASKVAEIYLLAQNVLDQIADNERKMEILRTNSKEFPDDPNLRDALAVEIELKAKLKQEFMNMIVNMIKRYM